MGIGDFVVHHCVQGEPFLQSRYGVAHTKSRSVRTDVIPDEILDHPLRVPFLPFSEDCLELIRKMLDRDVDGRISIEEVLDDPWLEEDEDSAV